MKKILSLAVLVLLCAVASFGQTTTALPFTVVTPPPGPTLTSLGNLSPTGKIYTGKVMPIIGTGFSSTCVVNVDGVAQASSTFVFVSATEMDYTLPASLGSSAGVSHTASVTCPAPVLTMNVDNPVNLPNGAVGVAYSANLRTISNLKGGIQPYTFSLVGSLPTGLTLSPSGVVSGTPSGPGSFNFSVSVSDSSGLAIRKEPLFVEIAKSLVAKLQ